jgi:hypothetical protein
MSFASFSTNALDDYLTKTTNPEALWFFLHIPKTAGTSMSSELDRLRSPYVNVSVDYERSDVSHDVAVRQAVAQFATTQIGSARSASGHVPLAMLDEVVGQRPGLKLFTLLRDPVARVVSDYTYQTTPAHPPFEAFKKRFPSIEDYVLAASEQNKMVSFLSGAQNGQSFDQLYKQIEQRFSFIGTTELYDMSFNIITRLMGRPAHSEERRRATSAEAKARVTLSPSLVTLIRQANHLDQQLYDRVVGALLPKYAAWQALDARG